MVIVTYCRVSTEEQSKSGYSLPEQRRECLARARAIAAQLGATPQIYEFEDAASGEVLDRPGLEACRTFIRQQPVNYFVCLDPDRFSRSLFLQLLVTDEIERAGIQLVFVQHNYESTPEGRLFYQMRGAIAEFEKAKIKERSTRGRKGKLAQGGIPNRVEPWGYLWDSSASTLRINPTQAPLVQQMFEWYADGWSYQRIADRLLELGVPPASRGQTWYRTAIQRMLKNSVYVGRLVLNRWDCAGLGVLKQLPREKRGRSLTMSLKPEDQWVTVTVPAIISEDLWRRAQAQHAGRTRLMQRGVGLLSGLCTCGLCGRKVHYMGDPTYRYLRCAGRYPHLRDARPDLRNAEPCPWTDVKSAGIERGIWDRVCQWLRDPTELARAQALQIEQRPVDQVAQRRAAEVERELAARRDEHRRVYRMAAKGLAPDDVDQDLERLKGQIKALEAEMAGLNAALEPANSQSAADVAAGLEAFAAQIGDELDSLELPDRQRLVRLLLRQVTVWPDGRWEYTLK